MMDAKEFTKEAKRMCLSHKGSCGVCGAWDRNDSVCKVDFFDDHFDPEETIRIVEEWSKAHPIQTNIEKFMDVFGVIPIAFTANQIGLAIEWWNAPYEAPKGEDK